MYLTPSIHDVSQGALFDYRIGVYEDDYLSLGSPDAFGHGRPFPLILLELNELNDPRIVLHELPHCLASVVL